MASRLNQYQVTTSGSTCQSCGASGIEPVLDLGYQPLCNEFIPSEQSVDSQTFYPLCLCHCPKCSLVQLDYVIPTVETFGDQYTYLTGSSKSLIEYYTKLAARLVSQLELNPGDTVIDIGSNDGTFLKAFQDLGMNVLGVEGARKSVELAVQNGVPVLERFFGAGAAKDIRQRVPKGSNIRLVTGMNVLAHTDNINEFLPEVAELMDPETVFVSQSHWLVALIQGFEFDTIYHEHLRYYTLTSLVKLLGRHGLNIFDAEITDFYGGSVLCYATKSNRSPSAGMEELLRQEEETDIVTSLKNMKTELLKNKAQILDVLVNLKEADQRVVGVGAPMKASTLLNFYGITSDLIEYIGEVNPLKVGTLVPGVRIPVLHEDLIFESPPDYAVLLSWNMANHIMPKYREMGYRGKFILPVPHVKVIE